MAAGNDGRAMDGKGSHSVNARYAAFAGHRGICIRDLLSPEDRSYWIRYETGRLRLGAVLAFSQIQLNLLAISNGPQILIYDVEGRRTKATLRGNGRIVTSISFAQDQLNTLATGGVDGSTCIWSLAEPATPLHHLRGLVGACSNVAVSPHNVNHLAVCHKGKVSIWNVPKIRPVGAVRARTPVLELLAWSPSEPATLAGVSPSGRFTLWNVKHMLAVPRSQLLLERKEELEEDDHAMFEEVKESYNTPFSIHELGYPVRQVQLLGKGGLIVLPQKSKTVYFYAYSHDSDSLTELWRLGLDSTIDRFTLRPSGNGIVQVVACLAEEIQTYRVPLPVLDGMRWSQAQSVRHSLTSQLKLDEQPPGQMATFKPERIRRTKKARKGLATQTITFQAEKPSQEQRSPASKAKRRSSSNAKRSASPSRPTMSSLELPKDIRRIERDSAMPFLSPSIPARPNDHSTLPPIEDTLHLPPLVRASFDSLASSTTLEHDSDSDDETFAGNMRSSGTLLPGGVNVPLPRTCGALFGMNGQLCTFFPSRYRAALAEEDVEIVEDGVHESDLSEATKLFPNFGNLAANPHTHDDSDSDGQEPWPSSFGDVPKLAMQAASFESRPSWTARMSPMKPDGAPLAGKFAIEVKVRDVEALLPSRKSLAEDYCLLDEAAGDSTLICHKNADAAEAEDLGEVADGWKLLALLLEQKPLLEHELATERAAQSKISLHHRPTLSRNISMSSEIDDGRAPSTQKQTQWCTHPFGQGWAVQKILEWAESRADVQTLACTSALIMSSLESSTRSQRPLSIPRLDLLASQLEDLALGVIPSALATSHSSPGGLERVEENPLYLLSSHASSRAGSQPTTPYLDSSANTPPLSFSALQRQSMRFSASGSASPEHNRGSFSAAAKYYAQSISDKIAAYGSSPPTKRAGTSPANELSSSLPFPSGSWSKSVSFASTTGASKGEQRSQSFAQDDDEYDSDKTIDEASLPHTPRLLNNEVSYQVNKEAVFFDELSAATQDSSAFGSIAKKSQLWCHSYAEQLRSWDLLIEAAELDNISRMNDQDRSRPGSPQMGVTPQRVASQRQTSCSACFCIIHGAEQLCPTCLHATHPKCLEDLIESLGTEHFKCPLGCGCNCAEATSLEFEIPEGGFDITSQPATGALKKKPSFTDPRRLRARLQGDSW